MRFSDNAIPFIFLLSILVILAQAETSFAFRCGTSLVNVGATKHEVIHKCGEPTYIESRVEERILKDFPPPYEYQPKTPYYRQYREPYLIKEYVTIDIWTYNLGPNRFIRYLTFENGILREITIGDRGY